MADARGGRAHVTVVLGRELHGEVRLDVDAVVVGTGAGGAMALRELARAGLSVIALEEGGFHQPKDFNQREEQMLAMLFADRGGRVTEDLAIRVLQGRGVGGSTVHNTNLCKRAPSEVLDAWAERHGVEGVRPAELAASYEVVERDLRVSEIPASMVNANNDVLRRGAAALGWRHGPLKHNRVGCQGSGFCELGCVYDAKQNALKVLVPEALAAGGRVYADVEARAIRSAGGRVTGIDAIARDGEGRRVADVTVRARVVVLAASAVGSAALLARSGAPDPYAQVGRRLRMHPGAVVAGTFAGEVAAHLGVPQSWECTELLDFSPGAEQRTWIVPAFAHPIGTAATLPGFGAAHMTAMRGYRHLAVLTAMLHDETEGRVVTGAGGAPVLRYVMSEADRASLARGVVGCARLLFAAGAREVTVPAIPPVVLRDARALDALDTSFVRPYSVPLSAVHPMGTLRMGRDPRVSVVSSTGEHHHVRGLFVADGSLFPTSLGGPPQLTIYALSHHLSRHYVAAARG